MAIEWEIINTLKENNLVLSQITTSINKIADKISIIGTEIENNNENIKDVEETEFLDINTATEQINFVNRILFISNEITEDTSTHIINMINTYNIIDKLNKTKLEKRLPIKIYISTDGGDLYSALSIVDAIQLSVTPIHTIVTGTALSGGFLIALNGHKRYCYPNASFMFHEGYCAWEGDAHKFHSHEKHYQNLLKQIKNIVVQNSNISPEYYDAIRKDDTWWNSQEALNLKMVDNILKKGEMCNEYIC